MATISLKDDAMNTITEMPGSKLFWVLTIFAVTALNSISCAADSGFIKIATAAPKGTIYHRVLQELCGAVLASPASRTRCVVYPDSIQGSEDDVVRRMRIGQIDAAMLTVVGLHDIDPSVTALQYMPMMFRSWEEMDYVRERLRPELEQKLAKKGFIVLFWGEAGWVQFFTKDQITKPEEYRKGKIFTWSGDGDQINIMKKIGFTPVGMQITDILPALETGMIDIVPVASLWALVGQFDRVTRYMLPIRWAPIVGATVMRRQTFDGLSPEMREAMMSAARIAGNQLRDNRSAIDDESIKALQGRGVKVLPVTPEIERAWVEVAETVWQQERNTMVPAETFDAVKGAIAEYRKAAKGR
jgi:TRAP-type C4-dicarboxylate transport system substrate-binding protein